MRLKQINGLLVVEGLKLPLADQQLLATGESLHVDVRVLDSRVISDQQRKFIFALANEIAEFTGQYDSNMWRLVAQNYYANLTDTKPQSLSNCSVSYANKIIQTLIDIMLENHIPINGTLLKDNRYDFTESQIRHMILKRKCSVCGKYNAQLHHVDTVGMGRNRKKISHIGMRILPLCAIHHSEVHTIGDKTFMELHHLKPVIADKQIDSLLKGKEIKFFKEDLDDLEKEKKEMLLCKKK